MSRRLGSRRSPPPETRKCPAQPPATSVSARPPVGGAQWRETYFFGSPGSLSFLPCIQLCSVPGVSALLQRGVIIVFFKSPLVFFFPPNRRSSRGAAAPHRRPWITTGVSSVGILTKLAFPELVGRLSYGRRHMPAWYASVFSDPSLISSTSLPLLLPRALLCLYTGVFLRLCCRCGVGSFSIFPCSDSPFGVRRRPSRPASDRALRLHCSGGKAVKLEAFATPDRGN
ncbi:hypothetical protein Taro_037161 [Colocasia esculenta]|uniref:Uncharacterized protein n=1 Tax=Colocasia esculenta TaxID=4460 RepID=A0A843WAC8_COLES|nr:hypothetical protein [Colocasia esculenta]